MNYIVHVNVDLVTQVPVALWCCQEVSEKHSNLPLPLSAKGAHQHRVNIKPFNLRFTWFCGATLTSALLTHSCTLCTPQNNPERESLAYNQL